MRKIEQISMLLDKANDAVVNNPKIAIAVPAATAAISPISKVAEIQGYLSIVSMVVGIVVSLILMRHWWVKVEIAEIERDNLRANMKARHLNDSIDT